MSIARHLAEMGGAARPTDGGLRGMASRIKIMAGVVHARLAARREKRRMLRQLACLDDRLLRDIGVERSAVGRDPGDLRGIVELLALLVDGPERG